MSLLSKRCLLYVLGFLVLVIAGSIFAAFGPPNIYAKSETPEFCGSCHVLQPEYEAWFHSGHRRATCVDCHLPNDTFANHLLWKAVDGLKDWGKFNMGLVSDDIRLSEHGAQVVHANCRRCHAEIGARLNEDRQCWFCHRRISHKRTGAILTLTP